MHRELKGSQLVTGTAYVSTSTLFSKSEGRTDHGGWKTSRSVSDSCCLGSGAAQTPEKKQRHLRADQVILPPWGHGTEKAGHLCWREGRRRKPPELRSGHVPGCLPFTGGDAEAPGVWSRDAAGPAALTPASSLPCWGLPPGRPFRRFRAAGGKARQLCSAPSPGRTC